MDEARLKALIERAVRRGEVKLASGATSDFYVDGKQVTLDPQGSLLVGEAVLEAARELGATALAGPATGACPMVSAAGVLAAQRGLALELCYVRGSAKGHGLQKSIEGHAPGPRDRVLVVEDVVTSGGSVLEAIERLRAETQATVVAAFCLVDRLAGGRARLEAAGVPLRALFTREDLDPSFKG